MRRWFDEARDVDVRTARRISGPNPSGVLTCPPANPAAPPGIAPRGQNIGEAPIVRAIRPPRQAKIGQSRQWRIADNGLALAAGVGATVLSPAFILPKGQVGWLQEWELYTLAPDATCQVQLKILVNGGPLAGYDNLLNPPGIARFVVVGEDEVEERLSDGAKIQALITNLSAGGPWTVGTMLSGWYQPLAEEKRVWGLEGY